MEDQENLIPEEEKNIQEEETSSKEVRVSKKKVLKTNSISWKYLSIIFVVALVGVIVGVAVSSAYLIKFKSAYIFDSPTYEMKGKVYEEESAIINAVSKAKEAVVSVRTIRLQEGFFFRATPTRGLASGAIVSPQGLVVTNNHVVEGATDIEVATLDGKSYKAEVVGTDPSSDIAILRITFDDNITFPYLDWGDSSKLKVGQRVIAIGNPYGLSHTVTAGVVSATDRSIETDLGRIIVGLIQTDAAINPGNSGGPLLDLDSNIVGINTAIVQGAQGLGFAASANVARKVLEDILTFGEPVWPWLGIAGEDLNEELAKKEGFPVNFGVVIRRIESDTPAIKAGLKVGDIIIAINGRRVANMYELTSIIRNYRVGEMVNIEVRRKTSESLILTATLTKRKN